MRIARSIFVAACTLWGIQALATPAQPKVHEYRLNNGLKLYVREDHRAPVVVSQVWYSVGSAYETRGVTGISHVVEHMMFKGTKKHGVGKFSRMVANNGGRHNAFTADDFTGYYQIFPAEKLKLSFELESDRMQNLTLDPKEFAKEIQVVMEERRMRTDDNPQMLTYERFKAAAFVSSPYHHPIVGWMDDLQNLTIQDVRQWYNTWYGPNNASVVVVGDVDPKVVYRLAKKYFGPIKPKKLPKLKDYKNAKPLGERRLVVKAPAKVAWLVMGYNAPSARRASVEWEPYALEVLTAVLDQGNSARIPKEIIRKQQIASSIGSQFGIFSLFDDLVMFTGTPAAKHTVKDVQKAIEAQIARLQTELVSQDELKRVKAQVIANRVFDKDSVEKSAMEIGSLQSVGLSWKLADKYADNIDKVTPEQIRSVAKKYLNKDHLTVAVLDPQPIDPNAKPREYKIGAGHGR